MKIKYKVVLLDGSNQTIENTVEIDNDLSERQIDMYLMNHTCIFKPCDVFWEEIK